MYVCVCKAVTERQVREAIRSGAGTRRAIAARLQVGTVCGRCHRDLGELLRRGRDDLQGCPLHAATL
ncbi:(2Fe-2S)-binding protein [Candidatus Methylocalor cossyra]|uniref:(2Fe-2S)-binding protein n=1 Tax=Candidatus Methylocalor cossyra TaxID=3108543 RepID=UPI0032B1F810